MATAQYQIEKGMAPPLNGGGPNPIYPFAEMDVGDCFVADATGNVRSAAYAYGDRHKKRFTCRTEPDGKFRVWRIA
jgi:hypothetical protein